MTSAADQSPQASMPASKAPAGPGAVSIVGSVLAIACVAVGVLAVRDALVYAGLLGGTAWLTTAAKSANGVQAAPWMVPTGAGLVLIGLWLLLVAVRPRPRTAVALAADTGVFLRPKDLARLAQTAAEDVPGVLGATVSATRRTVTVRVAGTGSPDIAGQVRAAVTGRLAPLKSPPAIRVRIEGDRS